MRYWLADFAEFLVTVVVRKLLSAQKTLFVSEIADFHQKQMPLSPSIIKVMK
jgi:hypothetical protein